MPPYTRITLSALLQEIGNRLFDPTFQFWTQVELTLYLQEALRTWNALTSYWRGDFTFNSQSGLQWMDLTNLSQMPNTLRPITLTDASLYPVMEYHLLEPASGINPWPGSGQFTAADFLAAVENRQDELLSITGCTLTYSTVPAVAGRIQLPSNVIDIRRIAYLPNAPGVPSVMWPDDSWAEQSFNRNYTILPAGIPFTYLQSIQPPISFDTDRPPAYAGSYELLTINTLAAALSASTPTPLLVPDDWSHVIKWGALADLFAKESEGKDTLRQNYCEQRFRMGAKLLSNASALLAIRLANVALQIDSVRAADLYQTMWEAQADGTPNTILHAGLNLIALSPAPNNPTPAYSFMATVVENAPVPSMPTDIVQVANEDMDAIIDYTQHLAALKMGGAEFSATEPLLKRFLAQAALYGLKLSELGEYTSVLFEQSQREDEMNPRMAPTSAAEGGE